MNYINQVGKAVSLCLALIFLSPIIIFGQTQGKVIGNVRVQVLSPTLVRIEQKGPNGLFEDRKTFHITGRTNWPGTYVTSESIAGHVLIKTSDFTVKVPSDAQSLDGIVITKPDGTELWAMPSADTDFFSNNRVWIPHPNTPTEAWAFADAPRYVPAPWGYNVAPADSPDYDVNGWDLTNHAPDVYVFLPGGDGRKLRSEYLKLTGKSGLIPLYALGGWDSRYYAYTQQEALDKIDTYRTKNIPLDVFVVDTDWRIGASIGYDVNTSLFPDMPGFLTSAHNKHVRIMFNDHPEPQADALDPIEVAYRNRGLRGKFDIGLDIWWYDRNWYTSIRPPDGINKEVFGMYLYHWITQDYYPDRRPLIMANVDGIDNGQLNRAPDIAAHRYTMQWTGDTRSDYMSLKNEVKNAVYSGVFAPFAYVSADLGGHMGTPTTEQYIRWVQYGALSPIFRLHCTKGVTRDPWEYAAPAEEVVRKYVQMRMRLLPVFYAAARENYDTGEPIIKRCDLDYPGYSEAESNDQYLLGKGILVAPITTSGNSRKMWIPPGNWINLWTGDVISGPQVITVTLSSLKQIPMFVKEGTIVPLAPDMQYSSEKVWNPITLYVYPGTSQTANATLYEDDAISNDYMSGGYRKTDFEATVDNATKTITVRIKPARGTYPGALSSRSWVVRLRKPAGWSEHPDLITVDGATVSFKYFGRKESAMPFNVTGRSPDGEVIIISVPSKSVDTERVIVTKFSANAPPPRLICSNPVISPEGGIFTDSVEVVIDVTEPTYADIYYTLDGTEPSQSATLYAGPITLTETMNLKARAFATDYDSSDAISALFRKSANGDGLKAEYYQGMNFNYFFKIQIDPQIDFNWGNGWPGNQVGTDNFSVRWTGTVTPFFSETYTFYTTTDDGVRLWVDNQLLINKWIDQAASEWSGTIRLTAGQEYSIKMEYYENMGEAVAQLRWRSQSQPKEIIPQSQLKSKKTPSTGLNSNFLNNNYPNPFNTETTIQFGVKDPGRVVLKVYNLLGKEVAVLVDKESPAGIYEVKFNGKDLASGVYLYRIETGNFRNVRKMVVLK
ncbi:MAG: DUF5110 domain-containing protein [FCB group bacterium]|nr:DUF5110 domain-containing protein [FCB group bacterium]